ncbi:MAG: acyl-homoserine-lactone synthase [Sphingopyxis sp.]
MLLVIDQANRAREHAVLRSMFEARKRVFIDLLKWDVPVLAGRFELDQFDDAYATYLLVAGRDNVHRASARLLMTTRPSLLGSLYPMLVEGEMPAGDDILEITRFCLSPDIGAAMRREARDALLVGLVDFALSNGISAYVGVAELGWFRNIQTFGWECRMLGAPQGAGEGALVALRIDIDAQTLGQLAAAGIRSVATPAAAAA